MMATNGKKTSLAAATVLLLDLWLGMCADARAEATTACKTLIRRYKIRRRRAINLR